MYDTEGMDLSDPLVRSKLKVSQPFCFNIYQYIHPTNFVSHLLQNPSLPTQTHFRPIIQVYKYKERVGRVERVVDDYSLIGKDLFSRDTDMTQFIGLKVPKVTIVELHGSRSS